MKYKCTVNYKGNQVIFYLHPSLDEPISLKEAYEIARQTALPIFGDKWLQTEVEEIEGGRYGVP